MAFISRTRNLSFLAAFVLGPLIACFATHGMLSSSTAYFSPNVFSVLCPVSLIYSIAAHVALRLYPAARFHHTNLIEIPSSVIADGRTRVAIVTGANTGIGFETARTLVEKHQTTVILACRSRDKAILAAQEINASVSSSHSSSVAKAIVLDTPLDLLSPSSITNFVQAVADEHYIIDILVNNAGRNTNPEQDGDRDVCFQSNFLGHFQLTLELLKRNILSSSHHQARIVNLSSVMHHFVGGGALSSTHDDLETQTTWNKAMLAPPTDTYALSKVAMVLFSLQLNALYGDRVRAFAINPGSVNSDIWRAFPRWITRLFKLIYLTPEQGAATSVAAAVGVLPDHAIYLQPYWLPFSHTNANKPLFPLFEMLGPFVGAQVVRPRLPADGGIRAGAALWEASQHIVTTQ